jgi:hypothetical protein
MLDYYKKDEEREALRKARPKAMELLRSPFFFRHFLADAEKAGLVGEKRNALALYIVATSRFRVHPVNALMKGKSSSGKNFVVRAVLNNFMPKETVHGISSMSQRSLNFLREDELKNSILYFYEIEGSARSAHPNRLLISEGKLVHWYVRSNRGRKEVVEEVTGGPVACVSTTTEHTLKIDDESRHLSLWIDESPEQTKRIAKSYAADKQETLTAEMKSVWTEVQDLLEERKDVPIGLPSWFERLVDLMPVGDVRVRRYWPAFVEACKTVALIRSYRRTKEEIEQRGGLVVTFNDFAITNLILDKTVSESLSRNASDEEVWIAEMVERIANERGSQNSQGGGVSAGDLVDEPGVTSLDKAYRLLRRAERAGTIVRTNPNEKNNEKFYMSADPLGFLGTPESVLKYLSLPNKGTFVHPLTGKSMSYGKRPK